VRERSPGETHTVPARSFMPDHSAADALAPAVLRAPSGSLLHRSLLARLASQPDGFGQCRPLCGVGRRNDGIIALEFESLAIFAGSEFVSRLQMPLQGLE